MQKDLKQLFYIRGGMTFRDDKDYIDFLKNRKLSIEEKNRWHEKFLKENLIDYCKIIKPRMPLEDNAKYEDWKIHFERYLSLLENEIILIGSSLGGMFLAKYLSENIISKKIISLYLICPPFDGSNRKYIAGGFDLNSDLSKIEKNCQNIKILFSEDDDIVPVSHAKKYEEKLKSAKVIIYKSKNGHFRIKEFPEIVEMIKNDLKNI